MRARGPAALVVALCATGCGSGGGARTATTATERLPAAHATQVHIASPRDDATLRARFDASGATVAASTPVSGFADPGTTVLVSTGCRETGCQGIARADGRGQWQTRVRVVGTPTRLTLPISAVYADAADDSAGAEVRVRLRTAR